MITSLQPESHSSMRERLSTASVSEKGRFEYWTDMVCATYVRLECDRPETQPVLGDIDISHLGGLTLTQLRSNVPHVRRTASQVRADSSDWCMVQIQREGGSRICQDGRQAHLAPGDFALYDSTRAYDLYFDDPIHDVIVVRIARSALEPHVANLEELTATTIPGSCAAGHLLLTILDSVQRDIEKLHPSSVMGVADGVTSIIAAGLRGLPNANTKRPSNLSAFHISRVKAYMMENLRNPELSIASIASATQLSADHLSRLFRSEPMPLSRQIWHQRLEACRRELSDPRQEQRGVSDIAYSWGFNDAAHFSRSFKEQFGATPREWRQHGLISKVI